MSDSPLCRTLLGWMNATPADSKLLADYVADGSDDAFAQLVNRYINLVYSAALRRTRDRLLNVAHVIDPRVEVMLRRTLEILL